MDGGQALAQSVAGAGNEVTAGHKVTATNRYLAVGFLTGADHNRYGKLIEELGNDYLKQMDMYPKTIVEAYNLLVNYQQDPRNMVQIGTNDSVAFTTANGMKRPPTRVSRPMKTKRRT